MEISEKDLIYMVGELAVLNWLQGKTIIELQSALNELAETNEDSEEK